MRWILIVSVVMVSACTRYSSDPELRVARDFIANYYMLADQRLALPFTTGQAKEELEKEIKLLEILSSRNDDHRSRDITFELKRESRDEKRASFLFQLKIHIPNLEERSQMISILVDRKDVKVMHFGNVEGE